MTAAIAGIMRRMAAPTSGPGDASYVQVAGAKLYVEWDAAVPRTLFVHGFGGDLHSWDLLWSELGAESGAMRYDLRGFGRSKVLTAAPFSHVRDLAALMDAAGVERCDLVGVSMGGSIALSFALNHPDRVRSLVLISPGLAAWEWSDEWRELWHPIVQAARSGQMERAKQLWWCHPLLESTVQSPAGAALRSSIERYSGDQWIQDDQEPVLPDVERLHMLRPATLLLTGGRDFADFAIIADLIEATGREVRRIHCERLGHLLHMEDPAHCAAEMRSFLKQP